jgi:3-dehydroquinate synthase
MKTLTVNAASHRYPIHVGDALLGQRQWMSEVVTAKQLLLVSNTTIAPLYAERVRHSLAGREIVDVILPDGEQHKSLATAGRVFDVLVANRFARDAAVLALGGGVVGDLAGFVAACYQRGIDYVQMPTTLLAQVDSSVGGKTAVNHPGGKNLIGAFHQPRVVITDVSLLGTLPDRELRAGLAEIIKCALICDSAFLDWLEANMPTLVARDPAALTHAIVRSCEIKAGFVERDERETGERALLNLGHSFGHAIEALTGYTQWLHGEAVGAGLLMAADLSSRMGLISAAQLARIDRLLRAAGLTMPAPQCGAARALEYMKIDKKVLAGRLRLILLRQPGAAFITADYDAAALAETLAAHFG